MDNLEYLISGLGDHVLSFHRASPDFRPETAIEFLEDQSVLKTDTAYIADASRVTGLPDQCVTEPGAILLVSSAGEDFSADAGPDITVIVTDIPEGKLFNLTASLLRESIFSNKISAQEPETKEKKLCDLWEQLLSGRLAGHEEIRNAVQELLSDGTDVYYRLSVIAADDPSDGEACLQAADKLRDILGSGYLFPYTEEKSSELILLQFYPVQPYNDFPERDEFSAVLEEYGLHMLIGHATRDYGRMSTVYRLYSRAGYLALQLDIEPRSHIFHFERYGMYNVIDMCAQRYSELFGHADLMYLIHPAVIHITRYDNEHGTNLRDILLAYLMNNLDLKHTAEKLYMHRNTLSNKLNLIRSITNIDLSEGDINQRIIFSCQVIKYYENVLLQNIRTGDHETDS